MYGRVPGRAGREALFEGGRYFCASALPVRSSGSRRVLNPLRARREAVTPSRGLSRRSVHRRPLALAAPGGAADSTPCLMLSFRTSAHVP
jgi:hypothetical protein